MVRSQETRHDVQARCRKCTTAKKTTMNNNTVEKIVNNTTYGEPSENEDEDPSLANLFAALSIYFVVVCLLAGPCRQVLYPRRRRSDRELSEKDASEIREKIEKTIISKKVLPHNHCKESTVGGVEEIIPPASLSHQCPARQRHESDHEVVGTHDSEDLVAIDVDQCAVCSICLENFCIGEDVSWSKNTRCNHVFHKECIIPWLVKHEACPCCRNLFAAHSDETNSGWLQLWMETLEMSQASEKDSDEEGPSRSDMVFCETHGLVPLESMKCDDATILLDQDDTFDLESITSLPTIPDEVVPIKTEMPLSGDGFETKEVCDLEQSRSYGSSEANSVTVPSLDGLATAEER